MFLNFKEYLNKIYQAHFYEDKNFFQFLIILNIIFSFSYIYFFNFNFGWDTLGYLGIGNILFDTSDKNFWDIKYYYSPGYSLLLGLTGVLNFQTLFIYKLTVFFIVFSYPFFVFFVVKNFDHLAAKISSILSIIFFCNSILSTDLYVHYFTAYFFLVSIFFLTRKKFYKNSNIQILFSAFFVFACFFRGTIIFCLPWFFLFSFFTFRRLDKNQCLRNLIFLLIRFCLVYLIIVGSYSTLRAIQFSKAEKSIKNSIFFGIAKGLGPRVMFQGYYTGGSFYLNKQGENKIFSPSNGNVSAKYFSTIKRGLDKLDFSSNPINQIAQNSNEAYDYLLNTPSHDTWYYLGWWLMHNFSTSLDEQDEIIQKVVLEGIKKNPDLYKYVLFNLKIWFTERSREVFVGKGFCDIKDEGFDKCFMPGSFSNFPVPNLNDITTKHFIDHSSKELYEELKTSSKSIHDNETKVKILRNIIDLINFTLSFKIVFFLLNLISILIIFFSHRLRLAILLNWSAILTIAILTSLVWPHTLRYWLETYILWIMNSSFVLSFLYQKSKSILKLN